MKTGIIDVGGGLRGMYASGIFDYCLDQDLQFDLCIGVSAGSANESSFLAGQKKRNYPFYSDYPFRKEYMSFSNWAKKKSYLDLDYIYGTLSNTGGENPLNYANIVNNPTEFIIVATNALTGKATYFTKNDLHPDDFSVLKASSAIPFICHPYKVKDVPYYDGALGDPIPLQKAFDQGCDTVILILTKPKDTIRTSGKDNFFAKMIQKKYPEAAEDLRKRAQHYNEGVELAKQYEKAGHVLIIAPDNTCGVDTLTKDKAALHRLYEKGYGDAQAIKKFLGR